MDFKINLQLFADAEKTEEATPKKRKDAREEGQVLQSREITAAFILLSSFLLLKFFGEYFINSLMKYMTNIYSDIKNVDIYFQENNLMLGFTKTIAVLQP